MRGPGMRLAILRHDQEQPPPLVRDAGLRQPRQGSGGPATAETDSKRLIADGEVAPSQSATTALPVVAGKRDQPTPQQLFVLKFEQRGYAKHDEWVTPFTSSN
jgi:hypothetical protein